MNVLSMCSSDERDRVQKKTFTKWVNKHLIKVCVIYFSWLESVKMNVLGGRGFTLISHQKAKNSVTQMKDQIYLHKRNSHNKSNKLFN